MLSHVRLFVTLWTVARQAPLSMGFPSKNSGVGGHFLLQGIFPTQGSNQSQFRWTLFTCIFGCTRSLLLHMGFLQLWPAGAVTI